MTRTPRILLHNAATARHAGRLRSAFPQCDIAECTTYEDLPDLIREFRPDVVFSIRFAGSRGFPRDALLAPDGPGWIANGGPYPVATFEATDAGELRRELERPVDECFEWCERTASNRGRCAEDWLRLEAGLHATVEMEARAEGMSVVLGSSGRFERRS